VGKKKERIEGGEGVLFERGRLFSSLPDVSVGLIVVDVEPLDFS
jgi:hypothetical protein